MKSIPILMPQMGQSVADGTIIRWRKRPGEAVAADEIIMEVESDKITVEVESPASGVLTSILKREGERAAVGEVVALMETSDPIGEVVEGGKPPAAHRPHAGSDANQILVSALQENDEGGVSSRLPELTRDWLSPTVLRLALLNEVTLNELQSIRGSGQHGRITKNDLLAYLAQRAARRSSTGTPGAGGHHGPRDIEKLGTVVPMTAIRRTIADHMVQSIRTSAHVTMVHMVDMTHIVELRERLKGAFERKYGVRMSYTGVMIYVTSRVLKDFPTINASVFGDNIVLRNEINIGCAVALQDESLVVPVIKRVDQRSFPEIAQDLERLIKLARSKQLRREDVEGGTFSISNFGAFGSIIGTPIIYQPQVAILGMGAIVKMPTVIGDRIEIRDQLYLSFSFDHRVIDGAQGGRFLNAIQVRTESLTESELGLEELG
ncbi:MAG: 2-oxo acid dehydrogenase subunit E2 [Kiritimatiellae bacterium]|nr:2-oxo acid dehydrogenase subunit E2 [Kiritimatiellia bacterium]MDW8459400.1 dihydrolipoamide acetyltransferase family protein [Verrucomicrobiota bacterium]